MCFLRWQVLNKLVNWLIDDPEAKLTQADVEKKEEEKKMLKVHKTPHKSIQRMIM
jgi:hypothetical protein